MEDFKNAYYKILKQNTKLHAEISYYRSALEKHKVSSAIEIESLAHTNRIAFDSILKYLTDNNLINKQSSHFINLMKMLPKKIYSD